jgi:hypothetical protein
MPTHSKSQAEVIEKRCLADHEEHVHKILLARFVIGYKGDNSVEIYLDQPARVRVLETSNAESDIFHWNDDWCDPYWDIELLEPHPQLEGVRSLWVDGPSRNIDGTEYSVPKPGWTVDPNQEPAYAPPEPQAPPAICEEGTASTVTAVCPCCGADLTIAISAITKETK